ncbi:hypothetical protein HDU91_005899 [Kappamyces sp. JEL0680]|nr:hypothetical protein HDU91_005899 [Kappamyces sp. JEL0680]
MKQHTAAPPSFVDAVNELIQAEKEAIKLQEKLSAADLKLNVVQGESAQLYKTLERVKEIATKRELLLAGKDALLQQQNRAESLLATSSGSPHSRNAIDGDSLRNIQDLDAYRSYRAKKQHVMAHAAARKAILQALAIKDQCAQLGKDVERPVYDPALRQERCLLDDSISLDVASGHAPSAEASFYFDARESSVMGPEADLISFDDTTDDVDCAFPAAPIASDTSLQVAAQKQQVAAMERTKAALVDMVDRLKRKKKDLLAHRTLPLDRLPVLVSQLKEKLDLLKHTSEQVLTMNQTLKKDIDETATLLRSTTETQAHIRSSHRALEEVYAKVEASFAEFDALHALHVAQGGTAAEWDWHHNETALAIKAILHIPYNTPFDEFVKMVQKEQSILCQFNQGLYVNYSKALENSSRSLALVRKAVDDTNEIMDEKQRHYSTVLEPGLEECQGKIKVCQETLATLQTIVAARYARQTHGRQWYANNKPALTATFEKIEGLL